MIKGESQLGSLISGTLDLDNLDNVIRLAFHTGLCSRIEAEQAIELAKVIAPTPQGIAIPSQKVYLIEQWQKVRKNLYEFLLYDWAEFSAKAMLTRAFEDAVGQKFVGTDNWRMTDDELIQYFLDKAIGETQSVKEMVRRLRLGELYTPILIGSSAAVENYKVLNQIKTKRNIEKEILRSVYKGRGGTQVLIHFILDINKIERAVEVTLKDTLKQIEVGQNSRSLLIGVFTSAAPTPREREMLQVKALQVLANSGCPEIRFIPDPLAKPKTPDNQMKLFNGPETT